MSNKRPPVKGLFDISEMALHVHAPPINPYKFAVLIFTVSRVYARVPLPCLT